jgi:membrane-associated phospholipid phosphatase
MIATTALSMQLDLNVRNKVNRGTNQTFNRDFWDVPTVYGFVQYPAIASGAMYITGLAVRNKWIRVTARLWLEALSYSGGAVMLIRYVTGRTRPYYSDNPFKYTWFQTNNDTQAFPSGHTVVAFATSTILAHRIDNIYASIGLYALASLTAYSRLINNQHWLSDVIAGAVLGFTSAYFVMNREWNREEEEAGQIDKKKKGKGGEKKFSFYPTFNGLGMSLRF